MREHMSCNDLAVSEGGCAGENCRLPVCVVCGRDWPCPVQRVLELHYNTATHHPSGCCSECGGTYPCPTVRAFDGGAE